MAEQGALLLSSLSLEILQPVEQMHLGLWQTRRDPPLSVRPTRRRNRLEHDVTISCTIKAFNVSAFFEPVLHKADERSLKAGKMIHDIECAEFAYRATLDLPRQRGSWAIRT